MNNPANLKALLAGSVLTAAFTVPSSAQTLNVDIAELEGKSEECRSLGQFIADQNGSIAGAEPTRVADAVNNDVAQECADIQALLTTEAGAAQDSATAEAEAEATTESVVTSEEATIVGEAVVRVPEPNVDVRVPRPEVTVRQAPPQVSVQDGAAQIEVEQAQPEIAVEIPTINVRVTMPAPSIYVLQGDPQVSVTEADPQVEVVQGEPEIIVTQPDPQLDIGLGVAQGEQAPTDQAQDTAEGDGAQQVSGNVDLEQQQPIVSFVAPAEEPQVDITRAEPEVSFSGATQPNVTITMTEEPTVDVQMTGEPRVTIETPEEREQRRAGQQGGATVRGRHHGGGDRSAEDDLGQRIQSSLPAMKALPDARRRRSLRAGPEITTHAYTLARLTHTDARAPGRAAPQASIVNAGSRRPQAGHCP